MTNISFVQVLERFVSVLRKLHPTEKLVIVSSFTTTLDLIESLASRAGWGPSFRLDGQVELKLREIGTVAFLIYFQCTSRFLFKSGNP